MWRAGTGATSSWHPLGDGVDGGVAALAVGPGGALYAGGDFTAAGGVTANRVARWDGARVGRPWQRDERRGAVPWRWGRTAPSTRGAISLPPAA